MDRLTERVAWEITEIAKSCPERLEETVLQCSKTIVARKNAQATPGYTKAVDALMEMVKASDHRGGDQKALMCAMNCITILTRFAKDM